MHTLHVSAVLTAIFAVVPASAAEFHPPAGENYALVSASGTVLPGGRLLKPFGVQIETGPGPFGIAVSPKGSVATADIGFERYGITVIEPQGGNPWRTRHIWARTPQSTAPEFADPDWKGVTSGIAFDSEKSLWVSEGASGRIRQINLASGDHGRIVSLNSREYTGSFSGDLTFDAARRLLYVVDQSNARVAVIDERNGRVLSSIRVGPTPFAIALSPDGATAYVAESNALCVIDVHDSLKPEIADRIQSPSPQGVVATADRVFVSNARDDSITVISAGDRKVVAGIPLGIPMLEQFRGVIPAGLAYDPVTRWLLVAETGINAVGVVDTATNQVIGHIPAGWMPTCVAISGDRVYITNARGEGTGPNPRRAILELGEEPLLHRGSVSTFIMPDAAEVLRQTGRVFAFNGFVPYMHDAPEPPAAIRHVVLIVNENRTFDEVMGDVTTAGSGRVLSFAKMARFGLHGLADGGRKQFSIHDAPITPNQHEIARRWAFSDNFYADGDTKAEGDIWLDGSYPDLVIESGILSSHGIATAADANISDQDRADRVIADIDRRYVRGGEPFPPLLRIHLPGAKPQDRYPYEASVVLDSDFAAGRIVDYLSHSPWWREMSVFITDSNTEGSLDHIDAHRTLLFAAGPYVKRNYVSHTNSSFPGLLRTIHELLGLPPVNLMDKTAASLRDLFTEEPDFTAFDAVEPDRRILPAGGKADGAP